MPPKQNPTPTDLGIGAPFGPGGAKKDPTFHLKPKKGPAADAARKKAALKKANDPIFHARQTHDVESAINSRVAATAGLTPKTSKPFGGGTGAKDAAVPELTAKTELAKARAARLDQGGLLTPAQQKHEKAATQVLATSRALNFLDRHNLKNTQYGDLTKLQPAKPGPDLQLGAPLAPPEQSTPAKRLSPREQMQAKQPGQSHISAGDILKTALKVSGPEPGLQYAAGKIGAAIVKDTAGIGGPHGALPHIEIPKSFLSADAQAAAKGKPVHADQLKDLGHFSLSPKGREQFAKMIEANGYNMKDAPRWNDQDYVTRAFVKNDTGLGGLARNAAADFGQQASLAALPSMIGDAIAQSIEKRSVAPAAKLGAGIAQGFINTAPFIGDRPWLENLQERPVTTIETVLPVAKWASLRTGEGLGAAGVEAFRGQREVTMPTAKAAVEAGRAPAGSEKLSLPASHEIITRSVQRLHDAVLAKGVHPSERARRPGVGGSVPGPLAGARHALGAPLERAGHRLEQRVEAKGFEHQKQLARLQAGRDPHLALLGYMKQIRNLPWLKDNRGYGAKIGAVEGTVAHEAFATDSGQLSEAFLTWADQSHRLAEEFQRSGDEAAASGDAPAAEQYHASAEKFRAQAKDQETQAKLAEKRSYALGKNDKLAGAARVASRQQTKMRVDARKMDEPGALYGDLQHRMAIVHATEGPGSVRGGPDGTEAWKVADKLLNHEGGSRHEFIAARADLHNHTVDDELKTPLDAGLDPRGPEAQHQLARHRAASYLKVVAEKRSNARAARVAEREGQPRAVDTARAAATHAGVGIDVVDTVLRKAHQGLHELRGLNDRREAELQQRAGEMEATERKAHDAKGNEQLSRLTTQLDIAKRAGSPPVKIDKIREAIKTEQGKLDAFQPSRDLLELRNAAEKQRLFGMVREVSDKHIAKIIMENTTPEQRRAVGFDRLKAAVHEDMDTYASTEGVADQLGAVQEDAAGRYNAATGKDVTKAQRFGVAHARYTEDLRAFRETQLAEGRDPFHARLHYPDEPSSLPENAQATGEQFQSGKFTSDLHFYMAKDLEGLSRQAVQAKLMENLSDSPLVLDTPPAGSEVPPGWAYVSADNWLNLKKTSKDADQVAKMLEGWRAGEATPRVPEGDTGGVLISKNLQEMLARELEHDPHEISGLLKATNAYRRWMLYTLPRTLVNNAVGNPILASLQGAGIKTYIDSIRILRNHPDLIMHTLRRRGPIANIMETDTAKMTGWQAFWRNANTFHEDNGNLMVYLLHAKRAFKQENGLHWFNQVNHMDEHFAEFLQKAARGENPDAAAWAAKSAEMFGDMFKTFKHDNSLAKLFLFHRWVGHMLYLQAVTMPFKYPGRTAFLQQTAIMADQYRKEHGVFPDWAAAYIPLWSTMEKAGGLPQSVTWALSTQGLNPFSTPAQSIDLGSVGQPKAPIQSLLASNITPLLRVPGEWAFGTRADTLQPFKDEAGNAISPLSAAGAGQLANSVIANTPIANTLWPRTGLSDNSIQVPILNKLGIGASHPVFKAAAAHDPSMRSPSPFGHGWLADAAITVGGALGIPIRPLDAKGNRTDVSAGRTATYQANEMTKRKNKEGEAEWKKSIALWQKDPAAWRASKYNKNP